VSFVATDAAGREWWFDVAGANTSHRGGLLRTDTVWKALGRASAARGRLDPEAPFVLLTTDLPDRRGAGDRALRAAGPRAVFDVVDVRSDQGRRRLAGYAADGPAGGPRVGFWTARDLGRGAGS
jgi:modification methylase